MAIEVRNISELNQYDLIRDNSGNFGRVEQINSDSALIKYPNGITQEQSHLYKVEKAEIKDYIDRQQEYLNQTRNFFFGTNIL